MRRSSYQLTYAVIVVGVLAYALLQSLVLPVLPTLEHGLHTTQDAVTWVLTAYLLSAAVFTPIIGRVGDMLGKARLFVITLGVLGLGSLIAALASSIGVMILARVVQGAGGALLPLAFGIIRDEFPKEKVGAAVGITAALASIGAGVGIVLGGPIISALDFHWLFWIPMIMVLLAGVAAYVVIPASPVRTPGHINWLAAGLLSAWLVALLVAVSEGESWGWGSERVIVLFVAAVVLALLWVRTEHSAAEPLIDMAMMRQPAVWPTNLVAFLFGFGLYSGFVFLPEFVQTPHSAGYGFGASVIRSGLFLLPLSVTMFVSGVLASHLARRFGSRAVLVAGSLISVVPFTLLALAHNAEWEIFLATTIAGLGFGLGFAAMSSLIVSVVRPEQTGVATGMNANIRTIGGSIGAALMASIVTSGVAANELPKVTGYTHGFVMLAIISGVAALAALLIPTTRFDVATDSAPATTTSSVLEVVPNAMGALEAE